MDSLTEPKLDFESVCVEHEDLEWGKGEVGGKQEDGTAMGMAYDDEAHDTCRRAPHQIQAAVEKRLFRANDLPLLISTTCPGYCIVAYNPSIN